MSTENEISDKDFFKYENIEEFRLNLRRLKETNFGNCDHNEIADILFSHMDVIPSLIANYSFQKFNTFSFYRVRLNINDNYEDLRLSRTYSYPLPSFCKENGRANLKNKSVFYASNSAGTPIIESKPNQGDTGYLSIWHGCADREMKAGVLLPKELNPENDWYILAHDIHAFSQIHLNKVAINKSSFFHEALNFISDLFLQENVPYPITSWIANELIYGRAWKDFIIYPSFANKAYTCNLAIHPNVADRYLKFVKVIRFRVTEITEHKYTLSTGFVGEFIQNNITWREATYEELDFSLFPNFVEEIHK